MSSADSSTSDRFDVAIAGGGVSGLYTAWRILDDAKRRELRMPRVVVLEESGRTGGRLLTWLPCGEEAGLRAELGGMRFLQDQTLVWTLLSEVLGFEKDIIDFPVGNGNLRQYLRGQAQLMSTKTPSARYELSPEDTNKPPAQIVTEIMDEVLGTPENRAVIERELPGQSGPESREDWDKIKPELTWGGSRLWDIGFWNLMSDVRSPETYAYVTDAFGYFSLASNWNAAEALQFFYLDFRPNITYHTLRQGYEALPQAIEARARELGCDIRLNTRLRRFQAVAGGRVQLEVVGADGAAETHEAERLVLAMPRRALELLCCSDDFDLQDDRDLKQLIQSVTPQPAFKLFLFYTERWWERLDPPIREGRSVSDMPIRQTYYLHPDSGDAAYGLLMASYDDARAVDYWQGLVPRADQLTRGRGDLVQALRAFAASDAVPCDVPEPPPMLHQATPAMLRHAKDQLALLHGVDVSAIPDPELGGFADWGLDPYGGGWNFWQPQVDVEDAMTRIKAPLGTDVNVNVVGDGYSGAAGWVEGALTATEATLQRHLQLPAPPWLGDCYLGW